MKNAKKIIMIPYADKKNANTGVNISHDNQRRDIYFKNCCVSLISAKSHNPACDVALITNTEIPPIYRQLLDANGILLIKAEYDTFCFPDKYLWSLAFYKLCALNYAINHLDYDYYCYMDSDVYIQKSFDDIWEECEQSILLYDINHGLQVKDYQIICDEFTKFLGNRNLITHYGGEFFAANKKNAIRFIDECLNIYQMMNDKKFITTKGDEFIVSLAAHILKSEVKNAGAYIFRFWTGPFHLVSTCYKYNPVFVIHVPNEKQTGMIRLYNRYISKGVHPSDEKVYGILHLKHPSLRVLAFNILRKYGLK